MLFKVMFLCGQKDVLSHMTTYTQRDCLGEYGGDRLQWHLSLQTRKLIPLYTIFDLDTKHQLLREKVRVDIFKRAITSSTTQEERVHITFDALRIAQEEIAKFPWTNECEA